MAKQLYTLPPEAITNTLDEALRAATLQSWMNECSTAQRSTRRSEQSR